MKFFRRICRENQNTICVQ